MLGGEGDQVRRRVLHESEEGGEGGRGLHEVQDGELGEAGEGEEEGRQEGRVHESQMHQGCAEGIHAIEFFLTKWILFIHEKSALGESKMGYGWVDSSRVLLIKIIGCVGKP